MRAPPTCIALALPFVHAATGCSKSNDARAPDTDTSSAGDLAPVAATADHDGAADAGYAGPLLVALFPRTPIMSQIEGSRTKIPSAAASGSRRHRCSSAIFGKAAGSPFGQMPTVSRIARMSWYELLAGGFVCAKHATLTDTSFRIAP